MFWDVRLCRVLGCEALSLGSTRRFDDSNISKRRERHKLTA